MANKSRWKAAHDRWPAHVEEARNSDGNVHRGYSLLEFRVAAELLRVGPTHSAEDYWAPSDWQLLLVVSEYTSALLEFLDWFWPDLGWEHHKQAIVLSKRLLQPRSPHTYPDLAIDPQLRVAWQSFTYCFWHGTRHLPAAPPPGEPPGAYTAAREWLTKVVGERGFEAEGHIVSSLRSWIQSMRPRLQEAFASVDWSGWPSVVWPDTECAYRGVEKRGAVKRRQQEEDYAVRWPLRVTQGRPKFNHLKLEARDGFVVGIPPVKNPPALAFLAVSDVMCAFKQAAQHWPSSQPTSPNYLAQQDVVQSFVQNVLRETRGPLAPGIAHEKYKYLGYVACSVLGWNSALGQLALPVHQTAAWGPQPLALPCGAAAVMCLQQLLQLHQHQLPQQPQQAQHGQQHQHQLATVGDTPPGLGTGFGIGGLSLPGRDSGIRVDLGIAAQLAMQPDLLLGSDTEALSAVHMTPPPPPLPQPLSHSLLPAPQQQGGQEPLAASALAAATCVVEAATQQGFGSVPLPQTQPATSAPPQLCGQSSASMEGPAAQSRGLQTKAATRPRPSPFGRAGAGMGASTNMNTGGTCQAPSPESLQEQGQQQEQHPQQQQNAEAGAGACGAQGDEQLDGPAPMSLGGLSSMQDLIDGLPSQADLNWSAFLEAVAAEDGAGGSSAGASGTTSELLAALPSLLLPSWAGLKPPPLAQQQPKAQAQAHPVHQQPPRVRVQTSCAPGLGPTGMGLQAFDSGLPCGELLQPPVPPPQRRLSPDAPVHVHPPVRSASPCQATITTGTLPSLALPSLAGLPSLGLPSGSLLRPEMSGAEQKFARRSHGEVFTLSPVTSCERPNGDTHPCSPAPAAAAAAVTTADAAAAAPLAVAQLLPSATLPSLAFATNADFVANDLFTRDEDAPPAALPTGGRRTRRDVAAAAAEAADQGLSPAPGSIVERSPKRPNAQASTRVVAVAERVESLGAFLTDQDAGLGTATGPAGSPPRPRQEHVASASPFAPFPVAASPSGAGVGTAILGQQLLQVVRTWAESSRTRAEADDGPAAAAASSTDDASAAAEVRLRVSALLKQGASVDTTEEGAADGAASTGPAVTAAASGPSSTAPVGYTALHWACLRGDVALAELLLRHGADPDRCDAAGTSARLVNPGFAAMLEEAVARCGAGQHAKPDTRPAAGPAAARSGSQSLSSVFASATGTAAAVAAAEAATQTGAQQNELRNRLAELLRSADHVAAQLALRDPQAAAGQVLQAMRDTDFLFSCIVSGSAARQ